MPVAGRDDARAAARERRGRSGEGDGRLMALYEIAPDRIDPLPATTFAAAGLRERADLQRLLRERD